MAIRRLIVMSLSLIFLFGCPSSHFTKKQEQEIEAFRRASSEERLDIARQIGAEAEYSQWKAQIEAGEIAEGMSDTAVLMAWGLPKFTEVSEDGRTEKWFYRWVYDRSYHLYFENDRLVSWTVRRYQRSTGR